MLGIQCLRNLGPKLTMEFCYGAKTIMLEGLNSTGTVVIEGEKFPIFARAEEKRGSVTSLFIARFLATVHLSSDEWLSSFEQGSC